MMALMLAVVTACSSASSQETTSNAIEEQTDVETKETKKQEDETTEEDNENDSDSSSKGGTAQNNSNTASKNQSNNTEANTNAEVNEQDIDGNKAQTDLASLHKEYLKKLNDVKNEVEEMRKKPLDNTTFALKKVEGDAYDIWDGLLNEIYGVLKQQLPTEEMDQLRKEQREWLDYRDHAAQEASLKYKGGTMEQYEYVRVENNLTEQRCFELVEDYMK